MNSYDSDATAPMGWPFFHKKQGSVTSAMAVTFCLLPVSQWVVPVTFLTEQSVDCLPGRRLDISRWPYTNYGLCGYEVTASRFSGTHSLLFAKSPLIKWCESLLWHCPRQPLKAQWSFFILCSTHWLSMYTLHSSSFPVAYWSSFPLSLGS